MAAGFRLVFTSFRDGKKHILNISLFLYFYKSKQGCKDQESIQSSTTPESGLQWESDKLTARHHKREPRGQPIPSR